MKPYKVLLLVLVLGVASVGVITSFFGVRIVLLPPASKGERGETVIMRGLYMLPLLTDVGSICIDPDARVVTESEVKICTNSVLTALSRHGSVMARLPRNGLLSAFTEN